MVLLDFKNLTEDQRILVVVMGVLVPGLGHMVSNRLRRGIAILFVISILGLLQNILPNLFNNLGNLLVGLQLLSESDTPGVHEFSQIFSSSFWNVLLLPSIAFWIWQIRDLIRGIENKNPLALTNKKRALVIMGAVILALGLAGVVGILVAYSELGQAAQFINPEDYLNSTGFQNHLNQTIRQTTYFLIYMNNALYMVILFFVISLVGFIVMLNVVLRAK